jgi:peroxiredoxin
MKTLGVIVILALIGGVMYSLITLFSGDRPIGSENLIGKPLSDFAAPLAGSGIDGDANIYTPAEAQGGKAKAACEVKITGSINSCDGLKGAAVLVFWNTTKPECGEQVTRLQRVLAKRPGVNAISLAFEDSMASATAAFNEHHWKQPVAVDPDGAVSSLYSVTGCPSTFFSKDGTITGVKLGLMSEQQLSAAIDKNTDG